MDFRVARTSGPVARPNSCRVMIAGFLVYFDNSEAQHAVDIYVPPNTANT